jgi:hypothetical protein
VQLTVLNDGRKSLALDGGGAELNSLQNTRVENVDTGVDPVSDELDRLLDEAVNARGVALFVDDDTVLGRLIDLGDHNRALLTVGFVESGQGMEGVLANDIGIENEERGNVFSKDLLGKLQGTGRPERLSLDREGDLDFVLFLNWSRLATRTQVANWVQLTFFNTLIMTSGL